MKTFAVPFFLLMYMSACQNSPQVVRPPLDLEKVSLVVQELRIMEAAYGMHYQQIDSTKTGWKPFHLEVFQRLAVTEDQFNQSIAYYTQFPDSLMAMDSLILKRLEPLSGQGLKNRIPGQKHIPNHQPAVNQKSGE
ncbi:MAG: hypothetical protein RL609_1544 [Bacteroidota bacterium]|jgi:hypothetical protein